MNRRDFVKTGAYATLASRLDPRPASAYQVGAIYFPNFHVNPGNEEQHGKGWTEWEVLKRGEPKFPGHEQPKRPAWGYLDEAEPRVFEQKIAAAHAAGINHFIFDWYWFDGKPFLERALEEGYLHAQNKANVRFCLMWANQDWVDCMPAKLRDKNRRPLYKSNQSAADFEIITDYILSHYFHERSYFLVDGAPYFSIYMLKELIEKMGGVDITRAALGRFREKTRNAGFPDLHINVMAAGTVGVPDLQRTLAAFGVKSVTNYTWAHHYEFPSFPSAEYKDAMESAQAYWSKSSDAFGVPYQLDVSVGWDPSSRACQSDVYERGDYPYTSILRNNTPELFRKSLTQAKTYLERYPDQSRIITVNAWNEWTEGSHLEPDTVHGMGYLDAIRDVFGH
jgi:hypothetical protein